MIPLALSGHRISKVLHIHRLHDHKVLPIRDNQEAISTALPISMDKDSRVSTRPDSKVNIHPPVDRCILHTDHRNPAKDDQHRRLRVPPHRQPPIRTEAMAVAHILHHHSSDHTGNNHHPVVLAHRRHPRPVHRVLPVNRQLAVPPDSNLRLGKGRDTPQHHNNHHNRTTIDQISLISHGGIPILRRTSSPILHTSSDRRCIREDGRAGQASTAVSILPRDLSNSGEPTTVHVLAAHPVPQLVLQELPEHPINGMRSPIGTRRISSHRTRLINRTSNSRGTRCHLHRRAHRCDRRNEAVNRFRPCNKQVCPAVCLQRHNPLHPPVLHQAQLLLFPAQRWVAPRQLPRKLHPNQSVPL